MTNSEIIIEQIRPELTWRLRQQILYPDAKLQEMAMEEDNHGYHFAAFLNNKIVGVVSCFKNGANFQFRKFAVDSEVQNMGIGKTLLTYIMNFAIAEGATKIWCNARSTATGFYARYGFVETGIQFKKHGFDYEVMEKITQPTS